MLRHKRAQIESLITWIPSIIIILAVGFIFIALVLALNIGGGDREEISYFFLSYTLDSLLRTSVQYDINGDGVSENVLVKDMLILNAIPYTDSTLKQEAIQSLQTDISDMNNIFKLGIWNERQLSSIGVNKDDLFRVVTPIRSLIDDECREYYIKTPTAHFYKIGKQGLATSNNVGEIFTYRLDNGDPEVQALPELVRFYNEVPSAIAELDYNGNKIKIEYKERWVC
ncbi:MAG: hypothetical protein ABIH72_01210 [archaeon]